MSENNEQKPRNEAPQFNLQIDDQTAAGKYSNVAMLSHTEHEFVVDFAFFAPGQRQGRVVSRVLLSPSHAKRLVAALRNEIERHEKRFGPIDGGTKANGAPEPTIQ